MSKHYDNLSELNQYTPLREKLIATHKSVSELFPFIQRIAIAIYDPQTTMLKTYLHSSGEDNPLENYQALLNDAPSLKNILKEGLPRVINNLLTFEASHNAHTKRIGRQGYAASYTLPIFNNGIFIGFVFFNSKQNDVFTEQVLRQIDVYGHMISLMVINELTSIQTLSAAVKTASSITHVRDPETGSHLDRMSRYSRIIATTLAGKYNLDDEYIEHIFMFSPLHDIGKISIPDNILLKPGKLNKEERIIMNTHANKGREIVDELLKNFGLENIKYMSMLRNIAQCHHEAINGKGYPQGIKGDQIPIEARIVAVADVFDALTSARSYKAAWSNKKAIDTLLEMAGEKLDVDCVNALIQNMDEVETIQKLFIETE
ncbi:HD domain-containing phosphohydrolase [uncultured Paraglaciecola sp.]|uniref:HD domain-containing phosphohydrolase n=1 Tax=uncultured Paraglaciecola sp. TaxID=1765024 RepID=UPI0030DC34CF|tara:strand:- start:29216 stop:30337 length:1122 start_codon:yes stop_codon:yes gene_type:complete